MTTEEINQSYQDFQDDLAIRELHLKILPTFKDDEFRDKLFSQLNEIKETPPVLILSFAALCTKKS